MCGTLEAAGPVSVTLEDAGDAPCFEPAPGAMPLWPRIRVRALYEHPVDRGALRAALPDIGAVTDLRTREIADRDWIAAAREEIEPVEIGSLWIGPEWAMPPPDRAVVRLEPGLAFGSGRHPTTRLCLERLAATPPVGIDVIDYGCGSGVLSIAAAVLGARRVVALDVDPQALRATAENSRINGVSDRVGVVETGAAIVPAPLVLANILAGTLVELAPVLTAVTAPGGHLTLSGLLEGQTDEVAGAYRGAFALHAGGTCDGWARLDGTRRPRPGRRFARLGASPARSMPDRITFGAATGQFDDDPP